MFSSASLPPPCRLFLACCGSKRFISLAAIPHVLGTVTPGFMVRDFPLRLARPPALLGAAPAGHGRPLAKRLTFHECVDDANRPPCDLTTGVWTVLVWLDSPLTPPAPATGSTAREELERSTCREWARRLSGVAGSRVLLVEADFDHAREGGSSEARADAQQELQASDNASGHPWTPATVPAPPPSDSLGVDAVDAAELQLSSGAGGGDFAIRPVGVSIVSPDYCLRYHTVRAAQQHTPAAPPSQAASPAVCSSLLGEAAAALEAMQGEWKVRRYRLKEGAVCPECGSVACHRHVGSLFTPRMRQTKWDFDDMPYYP